MDADVLTQPFEYGGVVNADLLELIGPLQGRVLDVGCGIGGWSDELRAAGAERLVGIEPAARAAQQARLRYDDVIGEPIERLQPSTFGEQTFSHVLAADVLEHLVNPWAALRTMHGWAAPDATLAVCVPNARHYRVSLGLLLAGRFSYAASGVMDWTHLRWFTRASLDQGLRATGWTPQHWRWVVAGGRSAIADRVLRGVGSPWLAQQIQVVAQRS
ncbi:MAG: class I SAM-dependent methyltransferase [Solirubrobacteraceae bacterium]